MLQRTVQMCVYFVAGNVENILLAEPSIPFLLVHGLGCGVHGVMGTVKIAML